MAEAEPPPLPIRSGDVPWTEWTIGTRFGERYRHLTRAVLGDAYRVGVAIEELAPGRQSTPAHYHVFEEEHLYMLDGSLTARIGGRDFPMKAGDYACFPAGRRAGHCLVNETESPCRYLIIGERNPDEVAVYTDSGKVLVRSLGEGALFDLSARRDYWDGEDTGQAAGERRDFDPVRGVNLAPMSPCRPISSADVAWDTEGEGPCFGGRSKHLTGAAVGEAYRVGVLIEAPAPGMRLAPRHYHMLEEEHAFVLEGEVTLLLGEDRRVMRPGDYVCFPAGQRIGHSFLNSGSGPCSYLMIGQRNPAEVCVYPDSNKVLVRALEPAASIFDMTGVRRYWDGEQTD